MKILKPFLKISRLVLLGILIILLLLNLFVIVQRVALKEELPLILNYGNAVIITGSMEPVIAAGDVVIIHKQDNYHVDDIVIYKSRSHIAHRIVEKTLNGYITQGDANNAPDSEINKSQVVGKVIAIIPKAGHVILFLQNPTALLLLFFVLVAIIEVPQVFKKVSHAKAVEMEESL